MTPMGAQTGNLIQHMRLRSAAALVVSNVVGVGIFTSTGFQAKDLPHPGYIFLLWAVGGVLAFCGALCYAELGAAMPQAGGEYVYIRETYGYEVGFMNAAASLVAGFAAPIASMAKGFTFYLAQFIPALEGEPRVLGFLTANDLIATAVVWLVVIVHVRHVHLGTGLNDLVTAMKVGGIVLIILGAAAFGKGHAANLTAVSPRFAGIGTGARLAALGTSLIFVMFTYSGWNAAAYMAGELRRPQRDLPPALLLGTLTVVVLYMGLNAVYLYGAGVDELAGKTEVGLVSARHLFGAAGTDLVAAVICVCILGAVSANTLTGARVTYALGGDFPPFRVLGTANAVTGAPAAALLLQGIVTTAILLMGRVDQIMQYAGFTLQAFAALAVSCVLVLRRRRPEMPRPFRAWGYPFTPLLFLVVSLWMMFWAFRGRPVESSLALATVGAAGAAAYLARRHGPGRPA